MSSNPLTQPCPKCNREVVGTRHQGGGFTGLPPGGDGTIPRDPEGWDFECSHGKDQDEPYKWFVADSK